MHHLSESSTPSLIVQLLHWWIFFLGRLNEKQTEINGIMRLVGSPNCKHSGQLVCWKSSGGGGVCLNISRPASVYAPLCQRSHLIRHTVTGSDFRGRKQKKQTYLRSAIYHNWTKTWQDFLREWFSCWRKRETKTKSVGGSEGSEEKFIQVPSNILILQDSCKRFLTYFHWI